MTARKAPKYVRLSGEERRAQLVTAGLACMARGGIQEFTVDRICEEAGVSRGLVIHHFGSMNALLAAVYASMYLGSTRLPGPPAPGQTRLAALLEAFFAPEIFNPGAFTIWLTLWGQISINDDLRAEHRVQYSGYLADVTSAIAEAAVANGREVEAEPLARVLICLIDGLGIQHCIEPETMPAETALAACRQLLQPHLGVF
ncbi:TetR/AcrR family transcriptional regulator [Pseudoroseicyclus tamaricis]|uniref:TetR family transcriptional regulator n=1 Tax=Pseudoroseicyclus tamaricis TaxID=2705421 RepID=A0A6B2JQG2_9RHOB|nr:TetR family transcriptional regulator C-terminal domain-containing protein [Pseudoroseicyclus tamaricis]NDV00205.1 TetR family transcriptional regulator [Pseudoroseicyclus tamaricis]